MLGHLSVGVKANLVTNPWLMGVVYIVGYEQLLIRVGLYVGRWTLIQFYLSVSSDRTFPE